MPLSQLHAYLVQNDIFEGFQSEFKANHSRSSDHDILVSRLEKMMGIWGMALEWFKPFLLTGLFQIILVNIFPIVQWGSASIYSWPNPFFIIYAKFTTEFVYIKLNHGWFGAPYTQNFPDLGILAPFCKLMVKNLGVQFNNSLKFDKQINSVLFFSEINGKG